MKSILDYNQHMTPEQIASRVGFGALLMSPCMPLFHLDGYGFSGAFGRPELWPAIAAAMLGMALGDVIPRKLLATLPWVVMASMALTLLTYVFLPHAPYFAALITGNNPAPSPDHASSATLSWGWVVAAGGLYLTTATPQGTASN